MEEPSLIVGITSLIICIIGWIVFIVAVRNFINYREKNFIQTRAPILIMASLIPIGIHIFIIQPISVLSFGFSLFSISTRAILYIAMIAMDGVMVTIFTKLWHQFVHLKKSQDTCQWKIHLNDTNMANDITLITKYWKYLGNVKYILLTAIIYYILICFVIALIFFIPKDLQSAMFSLFIGQIFFSVLTIIFMCYWYYSVIKFKDSLFIASEYKRYIFVAIHTFIITFILRKLLLNDFSDTKRLDLFFVSIVMIVGYVNICMLTIGLIWVPYTNIKANKQYETLKQIICAQNSEERNILLQLLETEKGYESFMNHLIEELATEHLLFFTQLKQFQDYLVTVIDINDMKLLLNKDFVLPSNLPDLKFVNDKSMTSEHKIINIWWLLYGKYISPEKSILTINVSHRMIEKLTNIYRRINIENCNELLQEMWGDLIDAGEDTYYLLLNSWTRFQAKPSDR